MARRRTPILYLAPWIDLGGSDKGTIDWLKHIDRDRWAPSLITTQPSSNRWLHHVEPYADEVWDLPELLKGDEFPAFILGFIESRGIEVVHIMNSRLGFDLLPDMTALPHPPAVVVQLHAEEPDRDGYVRMVSTRYGNLVDCFSVVSRDLAAAMTDYDIPPSRIETIYLGVDAEGEFDPGRVDPLPLPDEGVPRILWPGRLVEQKDPLLTVDVIAAVRARGTPFVLDLVGDGHLAPAVRERAERLGVADLIRWYPSSQEMARWYHSADLLLMTSVFEGVPLVIYEALAMGVPVVAPALPGNLELMDERCGATIAPRDDVDAYADAIVALLGDEQRRRDVGEHARARMLSDFSLRQMGSQHDALYERLLAARTETLERRAAAMRPALGEQGESDEAPPADRRDAPAPELGQVRFDRAATPPRTIGVVVPCHRHGLFLDACIASIKQQTLPPAAIVVVDDASPDPETIEALARLDADPDVAVLRQSRNEGPSAARNRGIATLDTSYVLPLDADDELVPDALERMVAELEAAPAEIGYVYPNARHIGNRADYVPSPAYNLWLLMCNNYIPAPALFDRRIFDAGIGYPEAVVYGHEDWDLILDLGAHGVLGRHIDGPTFLYRRRGFSRVNAVEYGPQSFHHAIERRHPSLFDRSDAIKARWAPAVSVLLVDDAAGEWSAADLDGRPPQSQPDVELVAARPLADDVRVVASPGASPAEWLATALAEARGRWVVLLAQEASGALRRPALVELLLRSWHADDDTASVVLGAADGLTRASFSQLDGSERRDAWPVGVIFARDLDEPLPPLPLTGPDLVASLVFQLQALGRTQWRLAPGSKPEGRSVDAIARVAASADGVDVALDGELPPDRAERLALKAARAQAPRLPGLEPGTIRRWEGAAAWIPPETVPLCRHREIGGERRVVTNSRKPRDGFALEFDLGAVHRFAVPGTIRLVGDGDGFVLTEDQDDLGETLTGLGYLEQAPFPLLELVELRTLPATGQPVLVAGTDDPLYGVTDPGRQLGWIEPLPIHPRHPVYHGGAWGIEPLHRFADLDAWCHRYKVGPADDEDAAVALGALLPLPGPDLVELRLRADGRLETDHAGPRAALSSPLAAARWVAAPLTWSGGLPPSWARRATGTRARRLVRRDAGASASSNGAGAATATGLGWLRRTPALGFSPLVSASHPATGDQFVTRSRIEASDLGYEIDGVLGYIFDAGANRDRDALPDSILWGSRFGKDRRYIEEGTS